MAGAIAGGVIGGLALAAILIALFLFWRVYRASKRGRRAGAGGHGTMRNWTGLSSRDSGLGVASLPSYTKKTAHYQRGGGQTHPSDSTNKILSANNSTIGHSTEDVCSLATSSLEAEKLPKHYSRGSFDFIDTIQPLSYNPNTRRRSSITISTTLTGTAATPEPYLSNGNGPLTRSSSQHRSSTLAKLEAADGGNGNSRRYQHRQSLDGRNLSHPMDAPAHIAATSPGLSSMLPSHLHLSSSSPSTPADLTPAQAQAPAPLAIGRSASGGASARRANRKPVPTYDASSLEMEDSPISGSPSSYGGYGYGASPLDRSNSTSSSRRGYPPVSPSTPTTLNNPQTQAPAMYANPKANYSNASGRSGTLGVGAGNAYGSGLDLEDVRLAAMAAAGLDVPSLNHKSSFGDGRPVHYLIPDMPPPQKD
ncbi:hypothetical protein NLI96_g7665 [Meripilus lineatus]|uniref:Uncharacterized protein n=1 Tax=Meripilus lineatus TaxID=2056292 RepID=A0AAD5V0J6_9APHY|nr:hypothetical protein NLI96_g7665 [Physisporinus lineatus]